MGNKREDNRDDLRKRLIDAAEARIASQGLAGLKAREVTTDAGCALGALYNAFEDLDRLILHVNSRSLARLGVALEAAVPEGAEPKAVLLALAQGYVTFALDHYHLWSAMFNHRLPDGIDAPEWHREEHQVLIAQIITPLRALRPDLDEAAAVRRAKTVFAAVHGVVYLGLTARFVGTPREILPEEVAALVEAMMRGLAA